MKCKFENYVKNTIDDEEWERRSIGFNTLIFSCNCKDCKELKSKKMKSNIQSEKDDYEI